MSIRAIGLIVAALGSSVPAALAQQSSEDVASQDWAVTVIDLAYADAAELARLLSEIVPPGVRVVPYYQTNSLIIAGERAMIEALTEEGENGGASPGGAERDAVDRSAPVEPNELITRR